MSGRVVKASLNTLDLDSNPSVVTDVQLDGVSDMAYGTRVEWEAQPDFVPHQGQIVVWSDHGKANVGGVEVDVPGFKVGDGNAYNLDLPFVGDDVASRIMSELSGHVSNSSIHVSASDRSRWNGSVSVSDSVSGETLVFTRE